MRAAFFALLSIMPTTAAADYFTGNSIHQLCSENRPVVSGYIAGWVGKQEQDAHAMTKLRGMMPWPYRSIVAQAGSSMSAACIPEGATLGQITDVFCKNVETMPEVRHLPASDILAAALRLTFSCEG